ncbi:MAG: helix-turn-helix domain-containing protein [Clostridia bacterium]|nr:helix-turn-helix domain-containing protein [Clostridia bacterium]
MKYGTRWVISDKKKDEYINNLLPHLATLRARVGVSQDELAGLVGISRQTYCLTESGSRSISWNTFLSIIMFYDYNSRTHDLIRSIGAFPEDLFYQFNLGQTNNSDLDKAGETLNIGAVLNDLDEAGKRAVKATAAAEYARCKNMSSAEMISTLSEIINK